MVIINTINIHVIILEKIIDTLLCGLVNKFFIVPLLYSSDNIVVATYITIKIIIISKLLKNLINAILASTGKLVLFEFNNMLYFILFSSAYFSSFTLSSISE